MNTEQREHFFQKHRLEALSDAVFAIVATLLVLDLKVPHDLESGMLGAALRSQSHEFFSFVMTFVIAAVFWTLQHHVFEALRDTGKSSLTLTFVMLGFVSLLPFTTSLIGAHHVDKLAFEIYFLNMCAIALTLMIKVEIAHAAGQLHEGSDATLLRFRLLRMTCVMLAAAIGVKFVSIQYATFFPIVVGGIFRTVQARLGIGKKTVSA